MVDQSAITGLDESLRGRVVQPHHPDYDQARAIYNGMIDKRPRAIARCSNIADVIRAVRFGREQGLDTAIRGGGHNGPGLALVDDGLVIDLSGLKGLRVDPANRAVRVEPGCTWGDVDHATHAFGLATVSGIISTTGVAGLTLGGGHGYLSRRHGLSVDNLLAADVVLADGSLVQASQAEHPDLFWALRGGGGNFGVVTSLEYRLHPVETVIAGPMFWPVDQLAPTLRWYRDWLPRAPEELYAFYLVAEVPRREPFPSAIQGERVCGLMWCCTGPRDQAEEAARQARHVAEPLFEHIGPLPYPALQGLFDAVYPPGYQWYWKGDFFGEIPDAAVAEHRRFAGELPTSFSTMHLYPVDGAVQRVEAGDTAWAHRDVTWSMVIAGVDPDPANSEKIRHWARGYWQALHPYSRGASYINFMMEEGPERISATYGENHRRLREVKARYDPGNFFHVNQNIEPVV